MYLLNLIKVFNELNIQSLDLPFSFLLHSYPMIIVITSKLRVKEDLYHVNKHHFLVFIYAFVTYWLMVLAFV